MFRSTRHAIKRQLRRLLRIPPEIRLHVDSELLFRYARHRLRPDAVYVEIGAGTGATAARVTRLLDLNPGRCHLVEACPINFRVLQEKMPGYRTYNYAVADRTGQICFYVIDDPAYEGTSRSNSVDGKALRTKTKLPVREIMVPSITMDDFFDKVGMERCDFMYMNCEGAEYSILRGEASFLQRVFLLRFDLHKGLYGEAKTERDMVEAKLAICKLLEARGLVRIGGHNLEHVREITTEHLITYWENESLGNSAPLRKV